MPELWNVYNKTILAKDEDTMFNVRMRYLQKDV